MIKKIGILTLSLLTLLIALSFNFASTQVWMGEFPESPETLETYPYQMIAYSGHGFPDGASTTPWIILCISQNPLEYYGTYTPFGQTAPYYKPNPVTGGVRLYQLVNDTWTLWSTTSEFVTWQEAGGVIETNTYIIDQNDEVYFDKTTNNDGTNANPTNYFIGYFDLPLSDNLTQANNMWSFMYHYTIPTDTDPDLWNIYILVDDLDPIFVNWDNYNNQYVTWSAGPDPDLEGGSMFQVSVDDILIQTTGTHSITVIGEYDGEHIGSFERLVAKVDGWVDADGDGTDDRTGETEDGNYEPLIPRPNLDNPTDLFDTVAVFFNNIGDGMALTFVTIIELMNEAALSIGEAGQAFTASFNFLPQPIPAMLIGSVAVFILLKIFGR